MTLRVAVVGAGYWGPNLARNFRSSSDWDLVAVCDLDPDRAARVVGDARGVDVETSLTRLLARDDLDAVAVATPANTHRDIAMAVLHSGRHVLVEKPLASSVAEATEMVEAARERGLVLMCDHTYCYTPVGPDASGEIVADGDLGDVQFVDSVRINLGLVQPDVDVLWDLAPHDLSILDFVLPRGPGPGGESPRTAPTRSEPGGSCVGYLTMPLPAGAIAHVHVNWLSPTKIRRWSSAGRGGPSCGTTSTPSSG